MGRLKPAWVKTDIPKDLKIKLWRIIKDNPTQVAREQAMARSEFSDDEVHFIPKSRDRWKGLEKEIREMPLHEVTILPQDLQNWILDLRPYLKEELKTASKHFESFTSLMERWRAQVKTDKLQIAFSETETEEVFYPVEKEPPFNDLRSYLQGAAIWQHLDDYKESYQQTAEFALSILGKLKQEAEEKTGLSISVETEAGGLQPDFWFSIIYASVIGISEAVLPPLYMLIVKHLPRVLPLEIGEYKVQELDRGSWELRLGDIILARGSKEDMARCQSIHQEMVTNFRNSKELSEYITLGLSRLAVRQTLEAELERVMSLRLFPQA